MKGIYILLIEISRKIYAKIGALGKTAFEKGVYAYIGSAQNRLEKRVARHMSKNKKLFWHIDYLLKNSFVKIIRVFYKNSKKSVECRIADYFAKTEDLIPGFGCSDCRCKAHLFRIRHMDRISRLGLKEVGL